MTETYTSRDGFDWKAAWYSLDADNRALLALADALEAEREKALREAAEIAFEADDCYLARNGILSLIDAETDPQPVLSGTSEPQAATVTWADGYDQFWGALEAERAKVAAAYEAVAQWQPIETAPQDGRMILVCLPRVMNLIVRARFNNIYKYWVTDYEGEGGVKVPHFFHPGDVWTPLPQPPKEASHD